MSKIKDKLLAAITSRAQLEQLAADLGLGLASLRDAMPQLSATMQTSAGINYPYDLDSAWPLQRDMLREEQGAYPPPTAVLLWLRSFKHINQHFPHVSHDDPTMVAFTVDMEGALKDKKVRISMGRFLRRFFPLYTDNAIRSLEASHRAELDPTLEIVTGIEAVTAAYTTMAGDSGCMRYGMDHFGHQQYHPAAIYGSPNFGVAVHRSEKGTVKSRAVVWTNPEDPDDKRYVRIYGDAALQRKLERHGYRLKGLRGTKVMALRDEAWADDPAYQDRFVAPYVDPAGGIHYTGSKQVDFDARYFVRYDDDPDFLYLVTAEERNKLSSLGVHTVDASSQAGSVTVPLSARGEVMVTCAISGKKFSRLEHQHFRWMHADGTLGWARASAIGPEHTSRQLGTAAGMIRVHGLATSFEGKCLNGAYAQYVDNAFTMQHMHLARLDPAHYPADQSVYNANDCVQVGDGWIRSEDAYRVQEKAPDGSYATRHVHKDSLKLLRKMGYVSMQSISGMKMLVHSSDERIVETVGGRKALSGVHSLAQLWDGRWDFARNVERTYVGNFTIAVRKGDPQSLLDATVPRTEINTLVFNVSHEFDTLADARVRRQFMRSFGRFLHCKDDAIVDASYNTASVTVESIIEAARRIVAMTDEAVSQLHYSRTTGAWARTVLRTVEMSEERREAGVANAEAWAEEVEVPQSQDDFDGTAHNREEMLLASLDGLLAPPVPTFMRANILHSTVPTTVGTLADRIRLTTSTNLI